MLLVNQGRHAEAEPLARAALDGPDPGSVPAQSERLAALVAVLRETGRAAEAEPPARRLLAMQAADPEWRGSETHARALATLAMVLSGLERFDEAEALTREAADVLEACLGPEGPVGAGLLLWLGSFHESRGDLAGAEALYRRTLDIQVRSRGDGDLAVAETLDRLGSLLAQDGRSEEAVTVLRRNLAILTAALDGLDPERAASLGHLADVLVGLERDGEAVPLYREQRAIIAAAVGRRPPRLRSRPAPRSRRRWRTTAARTRPSLSCARRWSSPGPIPSAASAP